MPLSLVQAVDFDPHSLRKVLPSAVRVVAEALDAGKRCEIVLFTGNWNYAVNLQLGAAQTARLVGWHC